MARPRKLVLPSDPMLLQAMVDGLELQKQRLDAQIAAVKAALGGGRASKQAVPKAAPAAVAAVVAAPAAPAKKKAGAKPKRQLSEAAREAIAAAQRKRWAKFRKDSKSE